MGKAEAILLVSKGQHRWVGATAPRSPLPLGQALREGAGGGGGGGGNAVGTCPVLLSAGGRVVMAVDAGTGDKMVLLEGSAPVRSMAVGGEGETVRGTRLVGVQVMVVVK